MTGDSAPISRVSDLQETWAKMGPNGKTDLAALNLRAGLAVARFNASDLLLDVDGGATLGAAHAAAVVNGACFPPIPASHDVTIAQLCGTHPILVEGFVSHVDATDLAGRPLQTPAAPRSAQGPDLMGALMARPPLAVCVRARVRCASMTTMARFGLDAKTPRFAAAAMMAVMRDGHAFSASAHGSSLWVVAKELPKALRAFEQFDVETGADAAAPGGVMLPPFDVEQAAAALDSGATLTAAPQMGRLSATRRNSTLLPLVDTDTAATQVAGALRRTGAKDATW